MELGKNNYLNLKIFFLVLQSIEEYRLVAFCINSLVDGFSFSLRSGLFNVVFSEIPYYSEAVCFFRYQAIFSILIWLIEISLILAFSQLNFKD